MIINMTFFLFLVGNGGCTEKANCWQDGEYLYYFWWKFQLIYIQGCGPSRYLSKIATNKCQLFRWNLQLLLVWLDGGQKICTLQFFITSLSLACDFRKSLWISRDWYFMAKCSKTTNLWRNMVCINCIWNTTLYFCCAVFLWLGACVPFCMDSVLG